MGLKRQQRLFPTNAFVVPLVRVDLSKSNNDARRVRCPMMQYQAVAVVRFQAPIRISGEESLVSGYSTVLGVNAPSFLDAVELLHDAALGDQKQSSSFIEQMEIRLVASEDWTDDVLAEIEDI